MFLPSPGQEIDMGLDGFESSTRGRGVDIISVRDTSTKATSLPSFPFTTEIALDPWDGNEGPDRSPCEREAPAQLRRSVSSLLVLSWLAAKVLGWGGLTVYATGSETVKIIAVIAAAQTIEPPPQKQFISKSIRLKYGLERYRVRSAYRYICPPPPSTATTSSTKTYRAVGITEPLGVEEIRNGALKPHIRRTSRDR